MDSASIVIGEGSQQTVGGVGQAFGQIYDWSGLASTLLTPCHRGSREPRSDGMRPRGAHGFLAKREPSGKRLSAFAVQMPHGIMSKLLGAFDDGQMVFTVKNEGAMVEDTQIQIELGDLRHALILAAQKSGRSLRAEVRQRLLESLYADGYLEIDTWTPPEQDKRADRD